MTVNSKAPIKDVQQFLGRKLGVHIPYSTAHKAKVAVCAETIMLNGSSTIWWKAVFNVYYVRILKLS